jgi:hypothetical protein
VTKDVIAKRLREAGIGTERFVDIHDGGKGTYDHTHHEPDEVSGNYGVRATATDNLVIIDVDDYNGLDDESGLEAIKELPLTLEEKTPHGGTHRFYNVPPTEDGRFIAAVLKDEFGSENPKPSWGEVRVANQYVVAAGSQLDGCDKEWCDQCDDPDGGRYRVTEDGGREIVEIPADDFVDALSEDPNLREEEEVDDEPESDTPDDWEHDEDEILEYALEESDDEKLKRLWRGDYSDYDGDRSEAESALAYKLAFWLQGDKGAVRRAMDRARTKKWDERTDDSYRESILEAVGKCSEYYDPSSASKEKAPTYDEEEVERGQKLLQAECTPTDPAGELAHEEGQYGYWEEQYDENGEVVGYQWDGVTNFTLETLEHLETDEGELLKVRVHPAHPMEDHYDVDIHPTVFNETRTFKEEIVRGRTTRYEPGNKNQTALNDLRETVGSQMVPQRTGVEHIGLVGEDYDEWVSPKGTITDEGAAEDPDHRFYSKGGSSGGSDSQGGALARKWQLEPETLADYDDDDVARILELLPNTRKYDRGLPILGWFYAAPLRPLIHDWEDEFNLLQVVGSTGTGKTSTLKTFWEAFGMDPDPFSASDTPFTLMKHMSSSNGIPVWIDEYKPADIRSDRLDKLHRRLREVTKGTAVSKGRANLGEVLFHIKAPVVVSGEQKFSQSVPAVRRRAIMTTLSEEPTRDGTEYTRAFCELTGTPYEGSDGTPQYPTGYDVLDHARAYYQYILSHSPEELRNLWNGCREDVGNLLSKRGLMFESSEFQGAQTILFGYRLYREFAEELGADLEQLPDESDVGDALEHFGENIGKGGKRRGYDDSFLELFSQAAAAGYIERDEAFRFVDSQKWETEVLAFHMPSVYPAVRRYVRDYNLGDEYNIIGKNDYISAFKDKIEKDASHVLGYQKQRLEGGHTRCVIIDPRATRERLGSDFDLRAFDRAHDEEEESSESGGDDGGGGGRQSQTEDQEAESQPAAQTSASASDGGSSEAAADGGEPDAVTDDGADLDDLKPDLPPEEAEGNRADARRLAWILEGSSSMSKTDIRNAAKAEFEMNLGRAGKVLDWAVEKTNLIEKVNEDADEYRV